MNTQRENNLELERLYENLRTLRRHSGWSITELEARSGIPAQVLLQMEAGGDFEVIYLLRLCKVYNKKPADCFTQKF